LKFTQYAHEIKNCIKLFKQVNHKVITRIRNAKLYSLKDTNKNNIINEILKWLKFKINIIIRIKKHFITY
jgi:nucleoside-triphosphatase THEP1